MSHSALSLCALAATSLLAMTAAQAQQQPTAPLYHEALRPQFHFTARYWDDYRLHPPIHEEGWINDLNGLTQFDGEYHLFAQRWWSAWLHATSTDLIHWKEFRPAFGKGGRFGGTQSGGAAIDTNNTSGLGDGKTPPMLAFWASTDNANQCMSYSLDRGLTWSKYAGNPILKHGFRDPKVFWYAPGDKWIMILYGPSDESGPTYGYNGENNDAHTLRKSRSGQWTSNVLRVFPDGKVEAADQNGENTGTIDPKKLNIGADGFFIGRKANGSETLKGEISEIEVYDRPLSDSEAKATVERLEGRLTPLVQPGLTLRLEARQATAPNGKLAAWKDLSGKGHDMVQTDASHQPTVKNSSDGKPVISFDGSDSLTGPAVLKEGSGGFTIAARWRLDDPQGSQVICEQNSARGGNGRRAALLSAEAQADNVYLLFESENLLDWKQLPGSIPDSYECPDMFETPVHGGAAGEKKWVVIDANGDYLTGSFDGTNFKKETAKKKGDYGHNFYATESFENMPASDPRRIQLAWMRGDDYPKDMPFNQQVSFPCELTLWQGPDGLTLRRYPIKEISKLYGRTTEKKDLTLEPGQNPLAEVTGELFDVELVLDVKHTTASKVSLELLGNRAEYDIHRSILISHGSEAPLKPENGEVKIRALADRLSLESYGNDGEVSLTNFAQRKEGATPVVLKAEGGAAVVKSVTVRELESIWK